MLNPLTTSGKNGKRASDAFGRPFCFPPIYGVSGPTVTSAPGAGGAPARNRAM
jgi:hypothetical protein